MDTSVAGTCPVLTGCPDAGEELCGCSAAQEGELCDLEFTGPGGEGCGFPASCTGGVWLESDI